MFHISYLINSHYVKVCHGLETSDDSTNFQDPNFEGLKCLPCVFLLPSTHTYILSYLATHVLALSCPHILVVGVSLNQTHSKCGGISTTICHKTKTPMTVSQHISPTFENCTIRSHISVRLSTVHIATPSSPLISTYSKDVKPESIQWDLTTASNIDICAFSRTRGKPCTQVCYSSHSFSIYLYSSFLPLR